MQTESERPQFEQEPAFPIPDRVPLFPLPETVFFPKTYLPLHVFEPRYRQMVADTTVRGQCIGMVLLKEGWEQGYEGNPRVFDVGCVGRIVSVQSLQDGRSNILLQGLRRFEIQSQDYDKPYREAHIALKPEETDTALEPSIRADLLRAVGNYLRSCDEGPYWRELLRLDISDEILVNHLSVGLECTPLEKQFLLEAETLRQRARRLYDLLQFILHEHGDVQGLG
ncbi:MAG: LON peptidase substrate-binding domain-containing protein [Nitrospira sp.]